MFKTVCLLFLFALTSVAFADGMIMPTDVMQDYLNVRYHHVEVTIDGVHATTQVEQEFYNPFPYAVSGQYLFPVPPDMILSDFQVTLEGAAQAAVRQDRAATNAILYQMVADRRDPSLLQYIDWETLALDIDLAPGGSRMMTIQYEEVLAPLNNALHYRYIMSTERYSAAPLESASITVRMLNDGISGVYSPEYPVVTDYSTPGQVTASWSQQFTNPTRDFDLFFTSAENGFGGTLLTAGREGGSHFMFQFAPDTQISTETTLPKDIVFVIDRSGSMEGEKILQAHAALTQILGRLNANDRFSIVGFDDMIDVFSEHLMPVTSDSIREAFSFVDGLTARNATDIGAGLQTGLQLIERSEARSSATKLIVFLTDGLPTAGLVDDVSIVDLVERHNHDGTVRIHAFGVGYDVNTHLLDRIAADNGGAVTYVQPGENLETVMTGFYARIANPALTNVRVTFEGMEVAALYPQTIPDLFQGSSVLIAGQFLASSDHVTVRVSGNAGAEAKEYVYEFDLRETGDHSFVSRLWVTRRIGHLLDIVRVEGETEELKAEIRRLGLEYGIVTPYTTFVIAPQADGAASGENMRLYSDLDALNSVSGSTTVQARVQNLAYQNSDQSAWAQGANIVNAGRINLVQVGSQYVDLQLVAGGDGIENGITADWLEANISVDVVIVFGSAEYFTLASDPAARLLLQNGTDMIFPYNGQTYRVQDPTLE